MKLSVHEFLNAVVNEVGMNNVMPDTPIDVITDAVAAVYAREGYEIQPNMQHLPLTRSAVFFPDVAYTTMVKSEYNNITIRESSYTHLYLQCMRVVDMDSYTGLVKFADDCMSMRKELKRQHVKTNTDAFFIAVLKCAVNMIYARLPHELRIKVCTKARETLANDVKNMQRNGAKVLCYDCDEIVYIGDVQKLSFDQHDEKLLSITFTKDKGVIKHYPCGRISTRRLLRRVKPQVLENINSQVEKSFSI